MSKNKGIAVAGIWIGVGLVGIGMGLANVQGDGWMNIGVVAICAMIATGMAG